MDGQHFLVQLLGSCPIDTSPKALKKTESFVSVASETSQTKKNDKTSHRNPH